LGNGAPFNDTASISASNPDPNTANNSATVTGSVVNINPNADLAVNISGPSSANEGDMVTYNITVTNAGPASATGVSLTDTLGSILNFKSATTGQGTFSVSGGVVTFTVGTIASGGTVNASVTAQALEDGSTSNNASVTSSSPDPNTANNTASATTSFAEPAITVSAPIRTRSTTLTNFQVATFTHASGVEPTSAFSATINWGDGTTSAGNISLSGTTYTVTGSHTYSGGSRHTVTTTVVETGNSPVAEGGNKVDVDPGTLPLDQRDVVSLADLSRDHDGERRQNGTSGGVISEDHLASLDAYFASNTNDAGGHDLTAQAGTQGLQSKSNSSVWDDLLLIDDAFRAF
jgi:uncharacterized repeat protein (TIGR01451 family)